MNIGSTPNITASNSFNSIATSPPKTSMVLELEKLIKNYATLVITGGRHCGAIVSNPKLVISNNQWELQGRVKSLPNGSERDFSLEVSNITKALDYDPYEELYPDL